MNYLLNYDVKHKWYFVKRLVISSISEFYNCHNPTSNPKQLKTTFVGVVLISVRETTPPHHHYTSLIPTTPGIITI